MTNTTGSLAFLATDVPANWNSQPQLYTDLNASALSSGGQMVHPILEPGAVTARKV